MQIATVALGQRQQVRLGVSCFAKLTSISFHLGSKPNVLVKRDDSYPTYFETSYHILSPLIIKARTVLALKHLTLLPFLSPWGETQVICRREFTLFSWTDRNGWLWEIKTFSFKSLLIGVCCSCFPRETVIFSLGCLWSHRWHCCPSFFFFFYNIESDT